MDYEQSDRIENYYELLMCNNKLHDLYLQQILCSSIEGNYDGWVMKHTWTDEKYLQNFSKET